MQDPEIVPDAYILKSELAMRRHAVLMPAALPAAKRQKTTSSGEPCACARAHAFVSDSPLSSSKQTLQMPASVLTSPHEIIQDPPDSTDASSEEEASFAVRTDSELQAAYSGPVQAPLEPNVQVSIDLPAEAAAAAEPELLLPGISDIEDRQHIRSKSRDIQAQQRVKADPQETEAQSQETEPLPQPQAKAQSQPAEAQAGSQQESTDNAGNSSHGTNVAAALPKEGADSPTSRPVLNQPSESPAVVPTAQPPAGPSEQTTLAQLQASGPYKVDAERRQVVVSNLKIYKAKVDEVHAMGRVSQTPTSSST